MTTFLIPGHLRKGIQLQIFFQKLKHTPQSHAIKKVRVNHFLSIERFASFTCLFLLVSIRLQAQQCTLPSRIFLPTADEVRYEEFGEAIAVDREYMVAGSAANSSLQVYAGSASVYKLNAQNKWTKIAELTPSDPGKYGNFGWRVAISGNSIVINAREYNDEGTVRWKLYVYEKSDGDEWVSGTEDYVITKDFSTPLAQHASGPFVLRGDELIMLGSENKKSIIEVFRKSGGVFSLAQTLDVPVSSYGNINSPWILAAADDFFVIGNDQFEYADRLEGAAFVYEKNGALYNTTPALLNASDQTPLQSIVFGISIAATNSTIFVHGSRPDGGIDNQIFYIFEKPLNGWVDAAQPSMLQSPGYVLTNSHIVANDNYLFSTDPGYKSIVGFKKPAGGWSSIATRFTIDDLPTEKFLFGMQLGLTDNHLVVGCPARYLSVGIGDEVIADYYSGTGAWEDASLACQQVIHSITMNATGDFFGKAFGVHNGQLAITADGDDEKGIEAGVVYIFDTEKQSTTPDQKIYNPENENYTGFGQSIAMGDSLMFIGAPYKDSIGTDGKTKYNIGKVYIYRLTSSGWKYASQVIAPVIDSEVSFGQQVVWSPGYCAVTEFYSGSSESVGRVHIYKENESTGKFEYIATLDPATHLRSDFFGKSMVMTDSMMVIGTGNFAPNTSYRMSVFVFKKKGEWKNATEDARLTSTDSGWSDRFGASVSMYGDYIVVGAPYSPGFDPRPIPRNYSIHGAVYIFKRPKGGWKGTLTETAKLTPRDPTELGMFGASVSIDHNDIFVGSPSVSQLYNYSDKLTNHDNTLIPGKVYHFTRPAGGWATTNQEARQLSSFDPEIVDGYGASLYVSGRYLYVGAMLDDTPSGFRSGSVQTIMQLPAIDAPPVLCFDQAPVKLVGFPKNGQLSGPGIDVSSGTFSPAVAGPGTHIITYTHSGCEATTFIQVLPAQMIVHHQSDALQTKCIGKSVPIAFESNEDSRTYMWYFKENLSETYTKFDSAKQVIAASKPGYYKVIVDRGACPTREQAFRILDEDAVSIKIEPVPLICTNAEIQLSVSPTSGLWSGPGISSDGKFNPINLADGNYKAIYKVVTTGGCIWKDSTMVRVDILKLPEIKYNGLPICGSKTATLTLTNIDNSSTIEWYNGGKVLQWMSGTSIQASEGGGYTARVSKGTCTLETAIQVVYKEVIDIQFDIPVVCSNELVMLNATPTNGSWQGPAVTAQGQFDPFGLADGIYPAHYTLVTPVGCTWQKSINVSVDKLKEPAISTDLEDVCINKPATLKLDRVDARTVITWHDTNGNEIPAQNGVTLTTGEAGTYFATVSKSFCSFRTPPVQLAADVDSLFVPNVFTANNDAFNDYFQIRSKGIDNFQLFLFNRYGQITFETKDQTFKWPAENVPSGVYFWRITYTTCSNIRREEKGWVHVIK